MSAPSIAPYYPFAGVSPVEQELNASGSEVTIRLEADDGVWPACSNCGQRSFLVHSYGRRRVRDLNLAHVVVWLDVPRRKVRCADCGVRVEPHSSRFSWTSNLTSNPSAICGSQCRTRAGNREAFDAPQVTIYS